MIIKSTGDERIALGICMRGKFVIPAQVPVRL